MLVVAVIVVATVVGCNSGRAGQVANVMIRKGITHSKKAGEFFMHP